MRRDQAGQRDDHGAVFPGQGVELDEPLASGQPSRGGFAGEITRDQEGQPGSCRGADADQHDTPERSEERSRDHGQRRRGKRDHHGKHVDQQEGRGSPRAERVDPLTESVETRADIQESGQDDDDDDDAHQDQRAPRTALALGGRSSGGVDSGLAHDSIVSGAHRPAGGGGPASEVNRGHRGAYSQASIGPRGAT